MFRVFAIGWHLGQGLGGSVERCGYSVTPMSGMYTLHKAEAGSCADCMEAELSPEPRAESKQLYGGLLPFCDVRSTQAVIVPLN